MATVGAAVVICLFLNMPLVRVCLDSEVAEDALVVTTVGTDHEGSSQIYVINTRPNIQEEFPDNTSITVDQQPVSCDNDRRTHTLFFYDLHRGTLESVNSFDGSTTLPYVKTLYTGISEHTGVRLAVDWVSQNVYWTDPLLGGIFMIPENPVSEHESRGKIVVNKDLEYPHALAIDPVHGFVFWSDIGAIVKIERASLTGSERKVIIWSGLGKPASIDADHQFSQLYWVDAVRETIETADYNGNNRSILMKQTPSSWFDIAIYGDLVIATDVSNRALVFYDKSKDEKIKTLKQHEKVFYGITPYSATTQPEMSSYCLEKNCSDICVSNHGHKSAECLCRDNYHLNRNDRTCSENSVQFPRALVVSNSTSVCLQDISILSSPEAVKSHSCIFTTDLRISFLDIDMKEHKIYFLTTMDRNILHSIGLKTYELDINPISLKSDIDGMITGFVVNWRDKAIYWSYKTTEDDVIGGIKKVPIRTMETISLLEFLNYPRDLVILPLLSKMAWISGRTGSAYIEISRTDGSNLAPKLPASRYGQAKSLTADGKSNLLYWLEGGYIRSVNVGDMRKIQDTYHTGTLPYLLHSYQNFLIWTVDVQQSTTVNVISKKSPTKVQNTFLLTDSLKIVKVVDEALQYTGPCDVKNGGCEQLCLAEGDTAKCACNYGFVIDQEGTCNAKPFTDNFLLVTDHTHSKIYQLSLDTNDARLLKTGYIRETRGIGFNHVTKTVIWSDSKSRTIETMHIDGKQHRVLLYTELNPRRFAIDYTSGNVYYTMGSPKSSVLNDTNGIGVVSPGGQHKLLLRLHTYPVAIAVDPQDGLLFWTCINSLSATTVMISNMDGTDLRQVIEESISKPHGLAVDYEEKQIYVPGYVYNTIQRCTYSGNCAEIFSQNIGLAGDMTLVGDMLYILTDKRSTITVFDKKKDVISSTIILDVQLGDLSEIAAYSSAAVVSRVSNACTKDGNGTDTCRQFCFPKSSSPGYTCSCKDGTSLMKSYCIRDNIRLFDILTPEPNTTAQTFTTTGFGIAIGSGFGVLILLLVMLTIGSSMCTKSKLDDENGDENVNEIPYPLNMSIEAMGLDGIEMTHEPSKPYKAIGSLPVLVAPPLETVLDAPLSCVSTAEDVSDKYEQNQLNEHGDAINEPSKPYKTIRSLPVFVAPSLETVLDAQLSCVSTAEDVSDKYEHNQLNEHGDAINEPSEPDESLGSLSVLDAP